MQFGKQIGWNACWCSGNGSGVWPGSGSGWKSLGQVQRRQCFSSQCFYWINDRPRAVMKRFSLMDKGNERMGSGAILNKKWTAIKGTQKDSPFQTLEIWELFVILALTDQSGWPLKGGKVETLTSGHFFSRFLMYSFPLQGTPLHNQNMSSSHRCYSFM